jgi:glycosyltransferase involved in cell wall biosynthesis
LIFPSLYEGFGLPVIEAMASGTPVVVSSTAAPPEVAGPDAIIVEPRDPQALAAGVTRAIRERERLAAAGLEWSRRFDWRETARRTQAVYEELL